MAKKKTVKKAKKGSRKRACRPYYLENP